MILTFQNIGTTMDKTLPDMLTGSASLKSMYSFVVYFSNE